jgi:Flp pilus assembly pilin Flp
MLKLAVYIQMLTVETASAIRAREEGQTMAEYAVVLAVVTALVIGSITLLSGNIDKAITNVANVIK